MSSERNTSSCPKSATAGACWRRLACATRCQSLLILIALMLILASCGIGGSNGGIVEVGNRAEQDEAPSDPITVPSNGRDCDSDDPEVGCTGNPAPKGTAFDFVESDLLVTYVDSEVTVEPNPDYGSPLAVRFFATFEVKNYGDAAFDVTTFVREHVVFDIAGDNPFVEFEAEGYSSSRFPVDGVWIEPGQTSEVRARYGLASRGWDLVERWGIGLREAGGFSGPALRPTPIDFGAASDSYAGGDVGVVESASPDSPEVVIHAFHEAIASWDIETMCAQLTSQAQVHFTGRLVAGDCPGVIREVMAFDWQPKVQARFDNAEVIELWTAGDEIPGDETIIRREFNEDGAYAVVRSSAGPWSYFFYDFAIDEGGLKIDVFYPIR